jgi:hypothetical protein
MTLPLPDRSAITKLARVSKGGLLSVADAVAALGVDFPSRRPGIALLTAVTMGAGETPVVAPIVLSLLCVQLHPSQAIGRGYFQLPFARMFVPRSLFQV